jgi:hypothetical protein
LTSIFTHTWAYTVPLTQTNSAQSILVVRQQLCISLFKKLILLFE